MILILLVSSIAERSKNASAENQPTISVILISFDLTLSGPHHHLSNIELPKRIPFLSLAAFPLMLISNPH